MKIHVVNSANAEQMKKKYESHTSLRADSKFSTPTDLLPMRNCLNNGCFHSDGRQISVFDMAFASYALECHLWMG